MTAATTATPRLWLRPWAPEHAEVLARLVGDRETMRFIGDGRTLRARDVAERVSFAGAHWLARGWGWRVGVHRETAEPVVLVPANRLGEGTVGLAADEHELGWFVLPGHRRQGYAVEAAGAVLEELLGRVGAPSVIARIQPGNVASVRVAEALGMARERTTTGRLGEPLVVYRRR